MTRLLVGALLLFSAFSFAQQQSTPQLPPYSTPPTFPQGQETKPPRTPPDVATPQEQPGSPEPGMPRKAETAQQIQTKIDQEPVLKGTDVKVGVDEATVTLTGTVDNEQQHDIALRIAKSYAGKRDIVDKIKIRS